MGRAKSKYRHAGEMTHEEQIRRLVKQRNDLWKFIDEELIFSNKLKHLKRLNELSDDDCIGTATIGGDELVLIDRRLWKELLERFDDKTRDALYEEADALVDNTYAIEGLNPRTGDDEPSVPEEIRKLYNVGTEPWVG